MLHLSQFYISVHFKIIRQLLRMLGGLLKCSVDCMIYFNHTIWFYYLFSFFINSLTPGRCGSNIKDIIFKIIIQNSSLGTCCEIAFKWLPHSITNEQWVLAQAMAECSQATSHHLNQCCPLSPKRPINLISLSLNQCWPRSLWPKGIIRL